MTNLPEGPDDGPLTPAQFHILLSLAEGQRHGYRIMQDVESRTDGAMELGPGTLYRSIKQLLRRGLIVEVGERGNPPSTAAANRRVYALSPQGRIRAAEEARRLRDLVRWAQSSLALDGGPP